MPDNSSFWFAYHDGRQELKGDPLSLQRALRRETQGTLEQLLKSARDSDPMVSVPAAEAVLAATRAAFGLMPYDPTTGEGVMDRDVIALLRQFREFDAQVKKKADG